MPLRGVFRWRPTQPLLRAGRHVGQLRADFRSFDIRGALRGRLAAVDVAADTFVERLLLLFVGDGGESRPRADRLESESFCFDAPVLAPAFAVGQVVAVPFGDSMAHVGGGAAVKALVALRHHDPGV